MMLPILYTVLTTICAFLSLIFSGIKPIIDFGWMMTLGLIVSLSVTFFFCHVFLIFFLQKMKLILKIQKNLLLLKFLVLLQKKMDNFIFWYNFYNYCRKYYWYIKIRSRK